METLEDIALGIAFGDREFKCPFEHRPLDSRKNKIPPDHENKSGTLGRSMGRERIKVIKMDAPIQSMTKEKNNQPSEPIAVTQYGYSPHHLIPGNEIWNRKDGRIHPLLKWIHEKATGSIVNGDIGYINNAKYNGLDLPSHHKFSNIADWSRDENDQYEYAKGAMDQEGGRQFHDSHKAYSDMVWKALSKIEAKMQEITESGKCPEGDEDCPLNKADGNTIKYDPPYKLLAQLKNNAKRLRIRLTQKPETWESPLVTSRFSLMYAENMKADAQEKAEQILSKDRDKMGRPTDFKKG